MTLLGVFFCLFEKNERATASRRTRRERAIPSRACSHGMRGMYIASCSLLGQGEIAVSSRSHLNTGSDLDPNVLVWIRGESSILACLFALDERALPSRACLDGI